MTRRVPPPQRKFDAMDLGEDEDEHSLEMHLPYISQVFQGQRISVVPIVVGSIDGANVRLKLVPPCWGLACVCAVAAQCRC